MLRQAARALSLAVAGGISLVLMLYPYALNGIASARVHTGLPVLMLGVAGLFVSGLGFVPRGRLAGLLFSPLVAWLLVAAGAFVMSGG